MRGALGLGLGLGLDVGLDVGLDLGFPARDFAPTPALDADRPAPAACGAAPDPANAAWA